MGSEQFDYDAPDVPATTIADVVADIKSHGKLPPLSDEELAARKVENEIYRWQRQQRDQERRAEHVITPIKFEGSRIRLVWHQKSASGVRQIPVTPELNERYVALLAKLRTEPSSD